MPYIAKEKRAPLLRGEGYPTNAGELNFVLTSWVLSKRAHNTSLTVSQELYDIASQYLRREPLSYSRINEVVGALTCAGYEWRRRVGVRRDMLAGVFDRAAELIYEHFAIPYEESKIKENGDLPYDNR